MSFGLTLGAALQPAEAGKACQRAGLPSPCIANSDIKNNAITSSRVKNDSLTARDLKNEAGGDSAGGFQSEPLGNTAKVVRSVIITAKSSGQVIVNASGTFSFSSNGGSARCSITTGTTRDLTNRIFQSMENSGMALNFSFAGTRGFKVTKGSTTFNLVCDNPTGNTVLVLDSYMTALFVPTRY